MRVEILFDGDVSWTDVTAYTRDNFSITHRAVSDDFHAAINLFNFTLVYDSTIFTKLRAMTARAEVRYYDDNDDLQFYGYFKPLASYSYDGLVNNQTCTIEAQDFTELLKVPVGKIEDDDVAWENYKILDPTDTANSIVHALFTRIGLSTSLIASGVSIPITVGAFASESYEELAFEMLDTLLYEYGYAINFDREGLFRPVQWIIPSGTSVSYTFTDNNIGPIQEDIKDFEYEGNQVLWYGLDTKVATRLYTEDLPWDEDGDFEGYAVIGGFTYPPETNVIDNTTGELTKVYQEYEDTGVRWKTAGRYVTEEYYRDYALKQADFSQILITKNHVVYDRTDSGLTRDVELFFNRRARIRYNNPNVTARLLYYMHIDGDVVYKRSQQKSILELVVGTKKIATYDSRFIFDIDTADQLCAAQAQIALSGARVYRFGSEFAVEEGSYVALSLGNGVSATGLVMQRTYDGLTRRYEYEVAAFTNAYQAMTARAVTSLAKSRVDTTARLDAIPSSPSLSLFGPSIIPEAGATYELNHSSVETPTYQWYYTTVSGIDVAISGATSSSYSLAWATTLFEDSTVLTCQLSGKWNASISIRKQELIPSYNGLEAYWDCDSLPLIPDNTSGIAYAQDAWATTDSWAGTNTALSVAGGILTCTNSTTDPRIARTISFSGATNRIIRLRIRQTAGTISRNDWQIFYSTSGHGSSASYTRVFTPVLSALNVWEIIDLDMAYLTAGGNDWIINTITALRIDLGLSSNAVIDIDFIYIGNGEYSTPLLDNSGNIRHASAFGVVPIVGVSGNALLFDGVNDYVASPYANTAFTGDLAFWYKSSQATQGCMLEIRTASGVGTGAYFNTDSVWKLDGSQTLSTLPTDNAWHFAILTLSGVDMRQVRFGSTFNGLLPLAFSMDEAPLFSRRLSLPEQFGLYRQKTMDKAYTWANYITDIGLKPKYLGTYNATHPVRPRVGDWWVVYDTDDSPITRGLYLNVNGVYTRQTSDSGEATQYFMEAASDILNIANNTSPDYGTASTYGFSNFIPFLAANDAFISNLFAQYIKITTGGSIRGGDRYTASGTVADATKDGFYIDANGKAKFAGLQFEGSKGNGVRWATPVLLASLNTGEASQRFACLTNSKLIATVADEPTMYVRELTWNGAALTAGSAVNTGISGYTSLHPISDTLYSFYRNNTLYRASAASSAYSLVGSTVISGVIPSSLCAINLNDTCLVQNSQLRVYRWGVSSYQPIGNALTISGIAGAVIAAAGADRVVVLDTGNDILSMYSWDGSSFAKIGNSLGISGLTSGWVAPLNSEEFLVVRNQALYIYKWDGLDFIEIQSNLASYAALFNVIGTANGLDVFGQYSSASIGVYRLSYSLSTPYRYPFNS